MPYIVVHQRRQKKQPDWERILMNNWNRADTQLREFDGPGCVFTLTRYYDDVHPDLIEQAKIKEFTDSLKTFVEETGSLRAIERESLYRTFFIPKRNGSKRRIDDPCNEIRVAQEKLKKLIELYCGPLYHTAAYAYVKGRSTLNAIQSHQKCEANWFYKTDFTNFFGSITPEFALSQIVQIFPFSCIASTEEGVNLLKDAFDLCFLNNGLPQGTIISPMLTNLIMIPFDFKLSQRLTKRNFHYTRYADDLLITSKNKYSMTGLTQIVCETLLEVKAPFGIKTEKTKYISKNGKNFNLGLMYNKDRQITIGHERKDRYRAMIFNFVKDMSRGKKWSGKDFTKMKGLDAYYQMIDPTTGSLIKGKVYRKTGYTYNYAEYLNKIRS